MNRIDVLCDGIEALSRRMDAAEKLPRKVVAEGRAALGNLQMLADLVNESTDHREQYRILNFQKVSIQRWVRAATAAGLEIPKEITNRHLAWK